MVSHFTVQFPDQPGTRSRTRSAVQVLDQLAVLRPGEEGIGVERPLGRQTPVVVEGLGARGGGGRYTQIAALGAYIEPYKSLCGPSRVNARMKHHVASDAAVYFPILQA